MRTETITATDGRVVTLVVPPLPGQVWESFRIPFGGAKLGALLGVMLQAGGIATDGKQWRPTPLHRFRGTFEDWGWQVYNEICAHTGWHPAIADRLGMFANDIATAQFLTGDEVEEAEVFFDLPR